MKKHILSIISILFFALLYTSPALAEMNCPEGTIYYTDSETSFEGCIPDQSADKPIYDAMKDSGFSFGIGLGYATESQFSLSVRLGYDFGTRNDDQNFGIAIYTDIAAGLGEPLYSVHWSIAPSLYTIYKSFRFSFDLGIGFDYFDEFTSSYNPVEGFTISLLPQINFDWFLTERVLLGFSLKCRLNFAEDSKYHKEFDGNNDPIDVEDSFFVTVPGFVLEVIHFGFKF